MDAYTNLAFGRLLTAPSPPLTGTTLEVLAGQGARFPAPPFNASVWPTTDYPDPSNAEIVRVTGIAGDAFTIVRAQEGTVAQPLAAGFVIGASITKKTIDDLRDASNMNAGTLPDARLSANVALISTIPKAFPVGSVFLSVVSTNPNALLGYGTWVAFGAGRMLVGLDAGQAEFAAPEQTGGTKTHTLTAGEMPSHTHIQDVHTHAVADPQHNHAQDAHSHSVSDPGHTHQYVHTVGGGDVAAGAGPQDWVSFEELATTTSKQTGIGIAQATVSIYPAATGISIVGATATNQAAGGGGAHNNLPPYITVYMWKRTA